MKRSGVRFPQAAPRSSDPFRETGKGLLLYLVAAEEVPDCFAFVGDVDGGACEGGEEVGEASQVGEEVFFGEAAEFPELADGVGGCEGEEAVGATAAWAVSITDSMTADSRGWPKNPSSGRTGACSGTSRNLISKSNAAPSVAGFAPPVPTSSGLASRRYSACTPLVWGNRSWRYSRSGEVLSRSAADRLV